MFSPIHHTFGPHVSARYWWHAMRLFCMPWKWQSGSEREQLRSELQKQFGGNAALFANGREGLVALLRSLQFEESAEVIIQGFTCVALPNAVHAANCNPVYADCDKETLNLTAETVRKRITPRTRAVICQHTFGIPADTEALAQLCYEEGLVLIEDCAHVLPDSTGPAAVGRHGHHLLLSFGRDKAVSGVAGGAVVTANDAVAVQLSEEEERAPMLPLAAIGRLLAYADAYFECRPLYHLCSIGKACLWLLGKSGLLPPVYSADERRGYQTATVRKLPNACAALALRELRNLRKLNDHRRRLTEQYLQASGEHKWPHPGGISEKTPLLKFPLYTEQADDIRSRLRERNIYLNDGWNGAVVCPRTIDQDATNYTPGSCPQAEWVAQHILSLPTHPTMTERQAEQLVEALRKTL